jgi:hypothetical protein
MVLVWGVPHVMELSVWDQGLAWGPLELEELVTGAS